MDRSWRRALRTRTERGGHDGGGAACLYNADGHAHPGLIFAHRHPQVPAGAVEEGLRLAGDALMDKGVGHRQFGLGVIVLAVGGGAIGVDTGEIGASIDGVRQPPGLRLIHQVDAERLEGQLIQPHPLTGGGDVARQHPPDLLHVLRGDLPLIGGGVPGDQLPDGRVQAAWHSRLVHFSGS